jgi:hypothetical protein
MLADEEDAQISARICLTVSHVNILTFHATTLNTPDVWVAEQDFFNFLNRDTMFDRKFINELVFPNDIVDFQTWLLAVLVTE